MGDDFDLFPKRDNLDPFSFKTREKKKEPPEESEDIFGVEEQPSAQQPGGTSQEPAAREQEVDDAMSTDPFPPPEPPPETGVKREPVSVPEPEGPISESKTFDEPHTDLVPPTEKTFTKKRKTTSPFIVVGGALVIIIGILYLALTFLKRDKPVVPTIRVPEVSVPVEPLSTAAVSGQAVEAEEREAPGAPQSTSQAAPDVEEPAQPEQEGPAVVEEVEEPSSSEPAQPAPENMEAVEEDQTTAGPAVPSLEGGNFSVQTGAFILETSVRELERKLSSLGYETFRKEGSTTALMNMLTVGPFSDIQKAREAVSDLRDAGIESNLVSRPGGGSIINAGSYLLDENANRIEGRIRGMGYPVTLVKKEARLPMTFVRVGRFEEISEANSLKDELKGKGLDAIVVKLQ